MSIQNRQPAVLLGTQAGPLPHNKTVVGAAVTGTNVYQSLVFRSASAMTQAGIQVVFTGTPTGTISVRQSLDPALADTLSATNAAWSEVQSIAVTAGVVGAAATPNSAIISIQNGAAATQVVYTNASGSGTLAVFGFGLSG